jgi:hypothetical protein
MATTLAYQISRDLSNLHCELHHMGLSTRNSKETTVVKTCCSYFKDDVEKELQKRFGADFVKEHIRFQLPVTELSSAPVTIFPEE